MNKPIVRSRSALFWRICRPTDDADDWFQTPEGDAVRTQHAHEARSNASFETKDAPFLQGQPVPVLSGLCPFPDVASSYGVSRMKRPCSSDLGRRMRYVVAIAKRDWHAIAKLYVFGELGGVRDDGFQDRTFPSIRDIARRFRISRSAVGDRALREDWGGRRFTFQTQLRSNTSPSTVWTPTWTSACRRQAS